MSATEARIRTTPWVVAAVLVLAAGCARTERPADTSSGIEGRAVAGPQCPVVRADSPCPDAAVSAEIDVLQNGRVVKTFTTRTDGTFRVALEPGSYTLQGKTTGRLPVSKAVEVAVTAGAYTKVDIVFDTGIR
jgi:hypothetical protein